MDNNCFCDGEVLPEDDPQHYIPIPSLGPTASLCPNMSRLVEAHIRQERRLRQQTTDDRIVGALSILALCTVIQAQQPTQLIDVNGAVQGLRRRGTSHYPMGSALFRHSGKV
jgi:hypothetical protein